MFDSHAWTKDKFVRLMLDDLKHEYRHFHFYVHSAIVVRGLHRIELGEFFEEEAASEMQHVLEFGKAIVGLGGAPGVEVEPFPTSLVLPEEILAYILSMESEVVERYSDRILQAQELGGVDGAYLSEFYAEQILDSRKTVDLVRAML